GPRPPAGYPDLARTASPPRRPLGLPRPRHAALLAKERSAPHPRQKRMSTVATAAEPARIALVGTPNCGKTTLFNALTGLRQKVANYPGVTVEKKEGFLGRDESGPIILDLPGLYSLHAQT